MPPKNCMSKSNIVDDIGEILRVPNMDKLISSSNSMKMDTFYNICVNNTPHNHNILNIRNIWEN